MLVRRLGAYAKAYVLCVAIFCLLMVLVSLVPKQAIRSKVESSAATLAAEGDYPDAWPTMHESPDGVDNFTTSLSLNVAYHAVGNPLAGGFLGSYYVHDSTSSMAENLQKGLDQQGQVHYFRYWHGYLVILVPMLALVSITTIRKVFMIVTVLLAAAVLERLGKKARPGAALAYAAALMFANIWVVAESTPQWFCFLVALVASLYVIHKSDNSVAWGDDLGGVAFFVIGAITVFLDFLDTPVVALGLPLAAYIAVSEERLRQQSLATIAKRLLGWCVAWAVGYALLWVSKWGIGLAMLGSDGMSSLTASISQRASSNAPDGEMVGRLDVLRTNVSTMFPGWMVGAAKVLGVAWVALTCFFHRDSWQKVGLALFAVVLIPIVWYCALPNHSVEHVFFTYRTLCVAVCGLGLMVAYLTDWSALRERVAGILPSRAKRG